MSNRTHLGIRFDVWNGQRAWFWLIVKSRGDDAVIGAAAKEDDAVREARSSIEEMSSKEETSSNPTVAESRANLS